MEQIVASSAQGILLIDARDPSLPIAYVNQAYEQLTDYSAEQLEGTSWRSILAGDDGNPELAKVRVAIGCGEPCEATIPYYRKDGTTWLADVSIRPLAGVGGETRFLLCQHAPAVPRSATESAARVDVLQRALGQARQKIVSLDRTDPVSGLLRYEYFLSLLKRDLGTARREQRVVTIVVFGIVELDVYRQTFGANAADSCVRMIGAQIAGAFRRSGDLCARYDETTFVVVVPGQHSGQVGTLTTRVGEKVRNLGLHNPRAQSGRYLSVRSCMGEALDADEDAEALIARVKTQLPAVGKVAVQQQA